MEPLESFYDQMWLIYNHVSYWDKDKVNKNDDIYFGCGVFSL